MPLSRRSTTTLLAACRIKIAWQKAPGSLFEFFHDDPTCENQLVDKLETDLQTIHSFLIGSTDPITHQSKDPLINLTFRLARNSSTIRGIDWPLWGSCRSADDQLHHAGSHGAIARL